MERVLFYDSVILKSKQKLVRTVVTSTKFNHLLGEKKSTSLQICPQSTKNPPILPITLNDFGRSEIFK